MPDEVERRARQILVESLASQNGDKPNLLAGLRHGAWLDAQEIAPLEFHVDGILPEGSTLLVGPPKIGKSWLLLALALALAKGGKVLGISVDARPVLYLALEDSDRRLQSRCRKLLGGDPIPAGFEYLTRIQPGMVIPTVEAWLATLPEDAKPLVIIDTLGRVMPPTLVGESTYQRDYRVGSTLKSLVDDREGAALVIAHHDRKAGAEDFVDVVSGSHGLAGSADTIVVLARARGESAGLLKVTGRDVDEGEYAVEFQAGSTWELSGHSLQTALNRAAQVRATSGVGDTMAQIIGFVTARGRAGPAEIAEGLGLDPVVVRNYVKRAVESDRLLHPGRGLYTPVTSVTSDTSPGEGALPEVTADTSGDTSDLPAPPAEVTQVTDVTPPLELLADAFGDDIEELP